MANQRFTLSAAQQDIYFDQLHRPDNPLYNVGGYAVFKQPNIEKLKASHRWLISHHDAFGIRIHTDGVGVSQSISQQRTLTLTEVDLSSRDNPSELADRWLEQLLSSPIPYEDCELYQCYLIKLKDNEYRYAVAAHHLAIDGVGFANWIRHLIAHYHDEPLAEGDGLWHQVCAKDQNYLSGERYRKDQTYWHKQLAQLPDNPLPANYIGKFSSKRLIPSRFHTQVMPSQWNNNLNAYAQSLGVGSAQVMLAVLAYYFASAYQQSKITLGVPLHNRTNAAQKSMIGMFVSVSPLCIAIDDHGSFAQLVESIQLQQNQNLRHQRMPIGHIINQLPGNKTRQQIFDISFNYQQVQDIPELEGEPVKLYSISHQHETTPLGLKIFDYGLNKPLTLQLDYNLAYFNQSEVEALMTRLLYMVDSLLEQPNMPLKQLPLMTPAEVDQLEGLSNGKALDPMVHNCIHQMFEVSASNSPHRLALSDEVQQLDYQSLNQKANQIAHSLIEKGVQPNTPVALCAERTVDMVAAILGILKSGGAYLPIDPKAPAARIHLMLKDSGAKLMLTQSSALDKVDLDGVEYLLLDQPQSFADFAIDNPHNVAVEPHHLAYVIYTSGSTGQPKGVMVAHQTACTLAEQMKKWPVINEQKAWGWNANVVFDASIHGLLRMCCAQHVVILPYEAKLMPQQLVDIVAEKNIGVMDCTPSMAQMWFNAGFADGLPNLVIGGEAIDETLWQQLVNWQQKHQGRIAVNIYGPTECCVNITCHHITGTQPTIGRPLSHVKTYLMHEGKRLAPRGVVAELLIGGRCVTQGYLNRPQLTSEKFIQNPFNDDPQDRLYRTGDLVRYLENGNLAYVGRCDDQVKIRGYRIELGEIQSQLNGCDKVRESVVIFDNQRHQRLLAYVVADDVSSDTESEFIAGLKQQLNTRLPDYMVPDVLVLVERFQLTLNGKVDKSVLPQVQDSACMGEHTAPKNQSQEMIRSIWAALLRLKPSEIGINRSFFELGGHSLLAVELALRLAKQFNCAVTINDVFQNPSIAQLSDFIARCPQAPLKLDIDKVAHSHQQHPLASFAQQRLYFIYRQDKTSAQYNLPGAWKISGEFSADIAEQALAAVIERHESLRTTFANEQMNTVQVIHQAVDFNLTRVDLTALPDEEKRKTLAQLMREDADRPFCLEQDLMLRAGFVRLAQYEGVLLICLHHIATDGWSNNLLFKEFIAQYQAIAQGVPAILPSMGIQYADFALCQRKWQDDGLFEAQLDYWQKKLTGAPQVHALPLNRPRSESVANVEGRFIQRENVQTAAALEQIAKNNNASLFMLLHGAFALLLSRYSNSEDIVVAIPTANRLQQQLAPLIGFFVNTLALRIDCSVDCDFEAFLAEVKTVHLEGQTHQEVPFDLVVERLNPKRSNLYSPLFQIVFAMNTNQSTHLELPGCAIEPMDNHQTQAKFELSVTAEQGDSGLNFEFAYNAALFDEDFIEQMAGHFGYLLRAIARGPKRNIHQLPLFSELEAEQLMAHINRR